MAVILRPQGPLSLPCEKTKHDIRSRSAPLMLKNQECSAAKPSMALEEEPSGAPQELRRAIDCLESSVDLEDLPRAALEALAAGAVHFSLPACDVLFESGSTPAGVYLLASGRLRVNGTAGPGFQA